MKKDVSQDPTYLHVDTGVGAVTKKNMNDPAFAGLMDVTKRKMSPFTGN